MLNFTVIYESTQCLYFFFRHATHATHLSHHVVQYDNTLGRIFMRKFFLYITLYCYRNMCRGTKHCITRVLCVLQAITQQKVHIDILLLHMFTSDKNGRDLECGCKLNSQCRLSLYTFWCCDFLPSRGESYAGPEKHELDRVR